MSQRLSSSAARDHNPTADAGRMRWASMGIWRSARGSLVETLQNKTVTVLYGSTA